MNREIKFRVWDQDKEVMKNPDYPGYYIDLQPWDDGSPFVIMQYTGLQDCNGQDIYEGDVMKWWCPEHGLESDSPGWQNIVSFSAGAFRAGRLILNDTLASIQEFGEIKVIGNKFEDPELLEDTDA